MKKWLIGCLMILLFAAPPALAGHNKPDGSICNSGAYIMPAGSEYRTPTHHRKQCYECHEMIWEDHWTFSFSSGPTCQKQVSCGLCGVDFGPFGAHKFSGATCVAKAICTVCKKEGEIDPNNHDLRPHAAKAPTCLDIGWNEYNTCSRCSYTTYSERPALNHDLVPHAAKAPTCTEIGWDAYETCKRDGCNYTTYSELPALNHDLVPHAAKAPTCLDIGWNEYDTCSRCNYTTYYAELPALGHDYRDILVKPTCETDGYTLFACSRCNDSYAEKPTGSLGHWFGEWSPKGNDSHIARCLRRDCNHTRKTGCRKLKFQTAENESLTVCPVCGQTENGKRLEMIEGATAAAVTGKLPAGEVTARTNGDYLILTFEYAGKLTQPTGQVKITLPVELPEGRQLERIAPNGAQAELPYEINGGEISFILDFTESEIPAMLIRLIPQTSSL